MANGLLDYAQMVRQLQGGLLGNVAYDPYQSKKGVNALGGLEGARPYQGGGAVRAYHGTSARPFDRFELPGQKPGLPYQERGVFFTPNKQMASQFGNRTIPVDIAMTPKNSVTVDLAKIAGKEVPYSAKVVSTAINSARKNGKDFIVLKGMRDAEGAYSGAADQIIAVRPAGKVKNAATGATMFSGLLGALLSGEFDRKEPMPPM